MRVRGIRKCQVVTLMVMIQIVSWFCATSRPIASDSNHYSFYPEHDSKKPILKPSESKKMEEEMVEKGRIIGSKPPSCEKKCYGCEPCEAVQVPTTSSFPHLSPHYANYQPEAWRCHCPP